MAKKTAVAITKIVQPPLSIGCCCKPVLRAFPVTGEKPPATTALSGQTIALRHSEIKLPLAPHHIYDRIAMYIAQKVLRENKMVT